MKKTVSVAVHIVIFCIIILAAPGDLDTTFDSDGKVTTSIGGIDEGQAVAVQTDGKIVVAGYSFDSTWDFAVVRYNADGSLDTTFDSDGIVTTHVGTNADFGIDVAIQSDGKILVAGQGDFGATREFMLVRYNTDGSLDTTFDSDGKVITSVGPNADIGQAISIQTDGKILVAGYSYNGSNYDFVVVRYNTDGSLDTTFDSDGIVVTDFDSANNYIYTMTVQTDGKIVVAGRSQTISGFDFVVLRYNTNGSLDTTFDTDGVVTHDMGSTNDVGADIGIQSDGKIVIAGYASNGANNDFATARLNTDGSLDTTFDSDGKVITPIGSSNDNGRSLLIQTDGKILVAGNTYDGTQHNFAIVRYNSDGSLDNSLWGTGGITITDFGSSSIPFAMSFYPGGKVLVAGWAGSNRDFAVARYENLAPSAASVNVSGRVLSSAKSRRGVPGALIHITDQEGNIRTTRTNPFGYFRFNDIEAGQSLIINVYHKQYQFDTRVIDINDNITDLVFVSQ